LRPLGADLAFIISLKRSTLIFSYPQAGRPITPSFGFDQRTRFLVRIDSKA